MNDSKQGSSLAGPSVPTKAVLQVANFRGKSWTSKVSSNHFRWPTQHNGSPQLFMYQITVPNFCKIPWYIVEFSDDYH